MLYKFNFKTFTVPILDQTILTDDPLGDPPRIKRGKIVWSTNKNSSNNI